jgi:ribosomal protein S18 acetylase RimI-like enzyme
MSEAHSTALRLAPFQPEAGALVLGWVHSARELLSWCGRTDFPLAEPGTFSTWHADPDVHPYLLLAGETVCGYGELWVDRAEDEVELARILVAPQWRGRGTGRRFTQLLVGQALRCGPGHIWLRVLPDNAVALACYLGAGFVPTSGAEEATFNAGQPRLYRWLRWPEASRA